MNTADFFIVCNSIYYIYVTFGHSVFIKRINRIITYFI